MKYLHNGFTFCAPAHTLDPLDYSEDNDDEKKNDEYSDIEYSDDDDDDDDDEDLHTIESKPQEIIPSANLQKNPYSEGINSTDFESDQKVDQSSINKINNIVDKPKINDQQLLPEDNYIQIRQELKDNKLLPTDQKVDQSSIDKINNILDTPKINKEKLLPGTNYIQIRQELKYNKLLPDDDQKTSQQRNNDDQNTSQQRNDDDQKISDTKSGTRENYKLKHLRDNKLNITIITRKTSKREWHLWHHTPHPEYDQTFRSWADTDLSNAFVWTCLLCDHINHGSEGNCFSCNTLRNDFTNYMHSSNSPFL